MMPAVEVVKIRRALRRERIGRRCDSLPFEIGEVVDQATVRGNAIIARKVPSMILRQDLKLKPH